MEETISLKEIFGVLKKRLWMILGITALATILSGVVSFFFLTPEYETQSQFLVNQSRGQGEAVEYNDIRTNVELISTYSNIIKSPYILEEVISDLDLDLSPGALQNSLQIASEQNSQVVSVTVTNKDRELAADIANATVETFRQEVTEIMNIDNVTILSQASAGPDLSPVSPKPFLNMAIAFVLGAMIGVGLAFLLEYLDNTIKTEEDVEKVLGLPVLGVISEIKEDDLTQVNRRNATMSASNVRGESIGT
ncbi:capsular polysaccharide biosynthesis protein [Pontibacillus halophilus JSM 076056 = DSM 19796]|uniref:Capsular polysaccharide biosynthesis protein n=1 Tax=Pontibacillus halophilus JSM 076056 = DSM 19796 TaxID=1385510 RepID=A0A0A5GRP8_9BACI|nr:Wzz/FepE/Etk N-terminal domain-containing protein [Pontibacillus halophilus]KGX93918.1 capsular polysaccharide biosynthesis protein [Pontibacillus halophilus JSM 076056 = DSM 19796]